MTAAGLASALPLPVAAPLVGAVAAPLLGRLSGRLALAVSVLTLAASSVLLALMVPRVMGGHILVHFMGGWVPVHGEALGIGFAADPLGILFALTCAVVGLLLLTYALSELADFGRREIGSFASLFLLLDAALIGSGLTGDLFNLFVWFEVAALASYALTAYFLDRPLALEASFKILVLTTMASFAVFVGAALLYQDHGALNLAQLHDAFAVHAPSRTDVVALGLVLAGFATKAGVLPFHAWLPDAHTAAPGAVSALFSGLMVNLGIVAIARIVFQVFTPAHAGHALGLLMVIGLVSALVGSVLALAQDDLKRLLAYDTVSQMGVLLVALAAGSTEGVAGAAYHLVNHALFKSLLFLCAGAIIHTTGATNLSEMGGLARRKPFLTAAFVIGVASIAGVPPLNGHASRNLIHDALTHSHQMVPLVVLSAAEVVTFAALAKAAWLGFFRRRDEAYEDERPLAAGMRVALGALGLGCVGFGVVPGGLVNRAWAPAAAGVLQAGTYAGAVLGGGTATLHWERLHTPLVSAAGLLSTAVTLGGGGLVCWWWLRRRRAVDPAPVRFLRALHTGSVNDYAAYAALGLVAMVAVLEIGVVR